MNITDGSHRTKYYLSGDVVTLKDNGTDKIYYTYDADGDLISMNLNGKEYFYIRNVQNDVIGQPGDILSFNMLRIVITILLTRLKKVDTCQNG